MAKKTKSAKSKPAPKKKPADKKAVAKKAAPAKKAVAAKKAAPKKAAPAPKKVVGKKAAPAPAAKKAAPVKAVKPAKVEKPAKAAAKPPKVLGAEKEKIKAKPAPEVVEIEVVSELIDDEDAEIVLTDAEGRRYCRVKDCDQLSSVDFYCRYHYLLYWKKIQVRKKILTEGKLERYVEELTARYPDKFLDVLRKDLRSDKEFLAAIQELEIDESAGENEFEEETQTYIDEVRGMSEAPAREEEDF